MNHKRDCPPSVRAFGIWWRCPKCKVVWKRKFGGNGGGRIKYRKDQTKKEATDAD